MERELWKLGAVDAAEAVRTGRISAAQLVESHLARCAEVNPSLNAVTAELSDDARSAAVAADLKTATGKRLGPLHGIPVTIKENVDVAGSATTNGLSALENAIAHEDSPVVANLRRAGAIIIGRTNTPEFSLRWFTDNPLRGETVNPWNDSITCGGSSGGAAASLAAGIGVIAHGSDLGGSLRYPAHCCGLVTIRPSLGRVPAFNPSGTERPPAMALMSVQGPLARSVADARLALAAMAAPDNRDPLWKPVPLDHPATDRTVRVGMCPDPFGDGVDPSVSQAVSDAAGHLAQAGFEVEEVELPGIGQIASLWGQLLSSEICELLRPSIRATGSVRVNTILDAFTDTFGRLSTAEYMQALMERNRLTRQWLEFLECFQLILTPVSACKPFPPAADANGADTLRDVMQSQRILTVANVLGLPAMAVPTGLSDGNPAGVQIIGQRYREDICFDAAQAIEDAAGTLGESLWHRMSDQIAHTSPE